MSELDRGKPRSPSELPLADWASRQQALSTESARMGELRPHRRLARALIERPARLGAIALIGVGIHAGADRLDNRALWLMDAADGGFDAVVTSSFGGLGQWLARLVEWPQLVIAATWGALAIELVAVAALSIGVLAWPRRQRASFVAEARPPWPRALAVALAAVAGAVLVGREVQVGLHLAAEAALGAPILADAIGRIGGLAALVFSALLLGVRASVAVLVGPRWPRGLEFAAVVVALPPAVMALADGAPLIATIRGLLL